MKAQTFETTVARGSRRPAWLPWALVGAVWAIALAGGFADRAAARGENSDGDADRDVGSASVGAKTQAPLPLTAAGALAWREAQPATHKPSETAGANDSPKATETEVTAEAAAVVGVLKEPPQDAKAAGPAVVDIEKAQAPSVVSATTNERAVPAREAPVRAANARDTATPRDAVEKTVASEPKPRSEPVPRKPSSLAAPTTELPTITIEPSTPKAGPSTQETAQEATARATTHLNAKRWTEADEAFGVALAKPGGRTAAAFYGRARAREARGDDAGAESDLKAALGLDPRHPYALLLLGDLAKSQSDLVTARDAYRRYVEAWPNGRRTGELTTWLEQGAD